MCGPFLVSAPEKPLTMNAEAALEHLRSDGFLGVFAGDEWAGLDTDGNVVVSVGGDERTVTADEFCAQFASATFRVPTAEEVA